MKHEEQPSPVSPQKLSVFVFVVLLFAGREDADQRRSELEDGKTVSHIMKSSQINMQSSMLIKRICERHKDS